MKEFSRKMTLRDSFIGMETKNMYQDNFQEQSVSVFILVLTGSSLFLLYPGSKLTSRIVSFRCYFVTLLGNNL